MTTSQRAWRSAPCSLSLSCNGLMLPCSQMSKRTYSCAAVERNKWVSQTCKYRENNNNQVIDTQSQSVTTQACDSTASPVQVWFLPERWLVSIPSTLTTLVSSSKWSGWRGRLEFSSLSWAAIWMSWPWASTNKRAMQAIPEKAKNNILLKYYLTLCLNMNQILKCKISFSCQLSFSKNTKTPDWREIKSVQTPEPMDLKTVAGTRDCCGSKLSSHTVGVLILFCHTFLQLNSFYILYCIVLF